jgi:hypothetical protein
VSVRPLEDLQDGTSYEPDPIDTIRELRWLNNQLAAALESITNRYEVVIRGSVTYPEGFESAYVRKAREVIAKARGQES